MLHPGSKGNLSGTEPARGRSGPSEPVAALHITSRLLLSFHPSHNLYTVFYRHGSPCSWGLFKTGGVCVRVCVFSGGSPLLCKAVWNHCKRVKTPSVCTNSGPFSPQLGPPKIQIRGS